MNFPKIKSLDDTGIQQLNSSAFSRFQEFKQIASSKNSTINANFERMDFGRGVCISIARLEKDLSCKVGLRYFEIHSIQREQSNNKKNYFNLRNKKNETGRRETWKKIWKWNPTLISIFTMHACSVMSDSFATPWTVAHQASLSMKFSIQEYWSWLTFLLQGIFLNQEPNPHLGRQILYHCAT